MRKGGVLARCFKRTKEVLLDTLEVAVWLVEHTSREIALHVIFHPNADSELPCGRARARRLHLLNAAWHGPASFDHLTRRCWSVRPAVAQSWWCRSEWLSTILLHFYSCGSSWSVQSLELDEIWFGLIPKHTALTNHRLALSFRTICQSLDSLSSFRI